MIMINTIKHIYNKPYYVFFNHLLNFNDEDGEETHRFILLPPFSSQGRGGTWGRG